MLKHPKVQKGIDKASHGLTIAAFTALAGAVMFVDPASKPAPVATDTSTEQLFCLVQNIYHEARGESLLGQAAVAHVTLNRVKSGDYPDTICDVVWQAHQFSWTDDGNSDRMTDIPSAETAVDVALAVVRGKLPDPTGGSTHYYEHQKVKPSWAHGGYRLVVGKHSFINFNN